MEYQYIIINPSAIQENLMHNQEMIVQFLELYQTQIPIDLQALKDAVVSTEHTDIASKAHHIKPTMEYIGATDLRKKLQELETAGKEHADLLHIQELYQTIELDIQLLLQEIKLYKENL